MPPTVRRLDYTDAPLAELSLPAATLAITLGLGSGLHRRAGDPPGRVWAIGDRGPNLKIKAAVNDYGLDHLAPLHARLGAKVMPDPAIGPTLAELHVEEGRVTLLRTLPLRVARGRRMTGLPLPAGDSADMEPAFSLAGEPLAPDAAGADTEAVVALSDGSFRVAEEYGPSVLVVDPEGLVTARWLPAGHPLEEGAAGCPVPGVLPAIAATRRLNRGFEALALSPDERRLYAVFQSALAPAGADEDAEGPLVRIWRLDIATGEVDAQWLYAFDPPAAFERDAALGPVRPRDLKVCDAVCVSPDRLLVLERISHSARLHMIDLPPPAPLDLVTAWELMTLAQRAAAAVLTVAKTLVFTTDGTPEIPPDLEGMALLDPRTLLLVNDNDFGVEGGETQFWTVTFDDPIG